MKNIAFLLAALCVSVAEADTCGEAALKTQLPEIFSKAAAHYRADIVLPAAPNGVEKYAAEELVHHFRKAFGKAPEVTGEDRLDAARYPFHIYVGATKAAVAAGLPVGKLAPEEHIVKTCGNGLYLLGGDSATKYSEVAEVRKVAWRGTLYAAYDFLENEMGVKWLWPGETGEVVPKRAALKVGPIDRRAQEPLEFREYHFGGYKIKPRTRTRRGSSASRSGCCCASASASAGASYRAIPSRSGGRTTTRSTRSTSICCRTASACRIAHRRSARYACPSRAYGNSAWRNGADGGRRRPGPTSRLIRG